MTVNELCEVFSAEISNSFELSKDIIEREMLRGTNNDMTEQEIYVKMISNSILLSANLSAQVVVHGLIDLGVIPKDALDSAKMKPQLHLVKPVKDSSSQEE